MLYVHIHMHVCSVHMYIILHRIHGHIVPNSVGILTSMDTQPSLVLRPG